MAPLLTQRGQVVSGQENPEEAAQKLRRKVTP